MMYALMVRARGFALPTILLSSVILLAMLMVAIQALMSIRTSMNNDYYQLIARTAAESGAAAAVRCIKNETLWTQALEPNATDCTGTAQTPATCLDSLRDARCGVIDSSTMRSTYVAAVPEVRPDGTFFESKGIVKVYRKGTDRVARTYTYSLKKAVHQANDRIASRATERFWYFGNRAALDFGVSGNTVTPFYNTAPACATWCIAPEGSTVVTNSMGQLIFWTNGQTVWDRAGNVLQNSTGLNADSSATQAATSFPLGKSGTKYAIVTNTSDNSKRTGSYNGAGELYYSVIDMSFNGGLGSVTSKNLPLFGANKKYVSEASATAPKADGKGYWVVTHNPNNGNILVFNFDENGLVSSAPQQFSSGSPIGAEGVNYIGYGTLNFNNMYNRLVLINGSHCVSGATPCGSHNGYVRTMRFNAINGAITNEFAVDVATSDTTFRNVSSVGYSADFSHNDKYIYATALYPGRLYRYTLDGTTTSAQMRASEKFVALIGHPSDSTFNGGGGQVKRAPDGRMYVANYVNEAISVIDRPDAAPAGSQTVAQAIGWRYNGQPLVGGALSTYGLPQMVTSFSPFIITY